MRRYSLIVLVLMLALAVGATAALGCDSGVVLKDQSPQQMLGIAQDAAKDTKFQSGSYEVALNIDADISQMPADEQGILQAFVGAPITLSGDFALHQDPSALDLGVSTSLMGFSMQAGVRYVDDKPYVNLLGQWYEAPADADQQLTEIDVSSLMDDMQTALDESGVDPTSWYADLQKVGEETLDGTDVVHLTGTVDIRKMFTDVVTLMQSEKMAQILADLSGSVDPSALGELEMPTEADLDEALPVLEQMLKGATIDFWLAKSGGAIRKMVLTTDIVIPAELGVSGLSGVNVVATFNLDPPNKGDGIKAPDSPKSADDLEKDLMANPMLGGLLEGLVGGFEGF